MTEEQPYLRADEQEDESTWPWWRNMLQTGLLIGAAVGMLWLVLHVKLPTIDEVRDSIDELRARVTALGWRALPIFAGAYALVALTPIPVTIMAMVAGILFGTLVGSIVSVLGVLVGCWGAYWLARLVGRGPVARLLGKRSALIQSHLEGNAFNAVFLLRLMPGLPYWPVNYGAGAFGVGQRDFVVASGLAAIPGQVALVAIGSFVAAPSVLAGAVVVVAWIVVVVMTVWSYRSLKGTARALPGAQ